LTLKFDESAFQPVQKKQLIFFTKICTLCHLITLHTFIDFRSQQRCCSSLPVDKD